MLSLVPPARDHEVIYLNAGDSAYPIGLNVLSATLPAQRPLVASGVISVLRRQFGEFWGPRTDFLLRNALLVTFRKQTNQQEKNVIQ